MLTLHTLRATRIETPIVRSKPGAGVRAHYPGKSVLARKVRFFDLSGCVWISGVWWADDCAPLVLAAAGVVQWDSLQKLSTPRIHGGPQVRLVLARPAPQIHAVPITNPRVHARKGVRGVVGAVGQRAHGIQHCLTLGPRIRSWFLVRDVHVHAPTRPGTDADRGVECVKHAHKRASDHALRAWQGHHHATNACELPRSLRL
jgi:hypothetical protein